ncbi:MAG: phosphate ABC transporter permease subunit PstC [Syntrophomonadaceae bacterium]|nr:phosphate ABC transporter permease subunit PstC [Syntrophomonadaceae bacterium]
MRVKKVEKFHPTEWLMRVSAFAGILAIIFIFIFIFMKAAPVFAGSGLKLITGSGFDSQIAEAFDAPADAPLLSFGMSGLIAGTLLSTLLALVIAGILSVGAAITICELAPKPVAAMLLSVVRLMASIPSVVFGLIGAMIVVPFLENTFITVDMQIEFLAFFQMTGRNLLASVIVLAFMIAPTVITLSADALYSVPGIYKETGYAFGMSRFRVIQKILLPAARSGIIAGLILGAGRGIGEAIAVSMVCGGVGMIPSLSHGIAAIFTPVLPLAAAIVNKSEAMSVPAVESALFACGALLLLMGTLFALAARFYVKQFTYGGIHEV